MLLLIFLGSALISSIDDLKITPIQSEIPAGISTKSPPKTREQSVAIEGQFIIAEGNADHLFRPSDFIKEDAVQLGEGDTKNTKTDRKVSRRYDPRNTFLL